MDEEIITLIKNEKSGKKSEKIIDKKLIWLIFNIGERQFAIPSDQVKEILRSATIFPLPFVPPYIDGVLNRYGDPYIVVNIAALNGDSDSNSNLFIVLNDESQISLRITDVIDFFTASEKDEVHFTEEQMSDIFSGTLSINGTDVLVLKTDSIIQKVGQEIAAS